MGKYEASDDAVLTIVINRLTLNGKYLPQSKSKGLFDYD
jgi:hypothetical protein